MTKEDPVFDCGSLVKLGLHEQLEFDFCGYGTQVEFDFEEDETSGDVSTSHLE